MLRSKPKFDYKLVVVVVVFFKFYLILTIPESLFSSLLKINLKKKVFVQNPCAKNELKNFLEIIFFYK
jgi:hypothetical protein